MASVTSLMSSTSSSSIYGTRNVLSGLASGMDTESMIENAISGIKMKISALQQKRTKIEWQQEAYRSIIDKAVNFNTKYTSYSSKTNLFSNSFFTNAVNTTTSGTYADKVTATGKSTSDIQINSVKQMATAASYTVSGLGGMSSEITDIIGGKVFDIDDTIAVNKAAGSLSFQYGGTNGTSFTIKFDELENLDDVEVLNDDGTVKDDATTAEKLAQAIQNKLNDVTYTYTKNGYTETTTAGKAIKVNVNDSGTITFSDGLGNGNEVTISSSSGNIKSTLGISNGDSHISINYDTTSLMEDQNVSDYLQDKTLGFTYNGTTKTIKMSDVLSRMDPDAADQNEAFVEALNAEVSKAFGSGKITASYSDDGKLSFTAEGKGNTLSLGGTALGAMGYETGDSNYINTGKKLTALLGDNADTIFSEANRLKGTSAAIRKTTPNGTVYYVDSKGNSVDENGYRINSEGKALYDFEVNGAHIEVTEDTTLESLINAVNSNADAGVKMSYSKLTNEFMFTSTETGSNSKIEFGGMAEDLFAPSDSITSNFKEAYGAGISDGGYGRITFQFPGYTLSFNVAASDSIQDVADALNETIFNDGWTASYNELSGELMITDEYGAQVDFTISDAFGELEHQSTTSYKPGQDAVMSVTINGVEFDNFVRSNNVFEVDGMTITVKDTFNEDGSGIDADGNKIEPVSFTTTTDTEKIIDAIRDFVNDYNEMVTEIKNAYSTMPAQQTDGSRYEPLTAEDEEGMTESAIAAYEEKAKQGLLFGDSNLSSMYNQLLSAITPGGTDGQILREIGLGTSYSDGMTTLSLDEDALRNALESDPDKVRNAFTKTKESGSSSDGLMQTMQNTLNTFVKTTGEPKGVLIVHAGSTKAPTSLNSNALLTQMNSIDKQIERWQNKMSDQIDVYTTKFTRLEQLIAEMNSQSSALMGLMGGYSEY